MTHLSKYRALALSLDKSVFRDGDTIDPALVKVVRGINARIPVILVTEQHHTEIAPLYDMLGLSSPLVCCYGAYAYHPATNGFSRESAMDRQAALTLIDQSRELELASTLYINHALTSTESANLELAVTKSTLASRTSTQEQYAVVSAKSSDDARLLLPAKSAVAKLRLTGESDALQTLVSDPWVKRTFAVEPISATEYDVVRFGCSKGLGLAYYLSAQNIGLSETVAVGELPCDVSMLKAAGLAVVTHDAGWEVKKHADHLATLDGADSGLAMLLASLF
uniref:HAD hydrolase family protein n=1 Tax=Thaumasiovibrio occultus TaxID=1891184 RepID=UPI000B34F2D4|nr:HAD hydrolase family protein [Thaumasiovibrio occultus]